MSASNQNSADLAENALAVYTFATHSGAEPSTLHIEDRQAAVSDLICDLLHYANLSGMNTNIILEHALSNYAEELNSLSACDPT